MFLPFVYGDDDDSAVALREPFFDLVDEAANVVFYTSFDFYGYPFVENEVRIAPSAQGLDLSDLGEFSLRLFDKDLMEIAFIMGRKPVVYLYSAMRDFHCLITDDFPFLHERLQELPYRVLRVVYPLSEQGSRIFQKSIRNGRARLPV